MKNPLEAAEDYTKQAGWRDLAELKCCMCALGLLLGLAVPRRWRKKAGRCCFSERMRKLFRKNEKNVLRFCNKKAKEKRRLQRVKKPM